ncbi:hypothetical protein C8A01DRAFT_49045 [Parachaetomium inaequale]|uniref:Uncharacterized protein n=1 Tax=Parachaetomium inaequale TaxID=2588326 RepID=A0AAN6PD52_9PEZI|nr:hypothetical protein C8A01DRAFT_49045 [Parachaetomium inaequale]
MDPAGTLKQQQDLEIWREPWEKEMAKLPPDLRRPFLDPRPFNIATHARKIIDLLEEHGIPCCVTGTKALCYYGAPRICSTLEFCVPTEQLATADYIFSSGPAKENYTAWKGRQPGAEAWVSGSLYHTFPRYRLNHDGHLFGFYLVPSIDWRFDCAPENFEYSAQKHIPYPKLNLFAQSLLERQDTGDLQDLVDGMDLTEEWGEGNLKFDDPGTEIREATPQEVKDDPINVMFGTEVYELPEGPTDFREVFARLVRTKSRRIGLESPPGLYDTKYRAKDSPDPRTRIRFHV